MLSMVSGGSVQLNEKDNSAQKKSVGRSSSGKKEGAKVPRKVNKAEREKRKRDHMNELFLELAKALEPANENNGKSSTLTDTIRVLRDLIAQVDSLRKENSTLLAESQYVALEKNELKEDNSAIEAQISKLQSQIDERVHPQPLWRLDPSSQLRNDSGATKSLENNVVLPKVDGAAQAPVLGQVFILPLQNEPELYTEPGMTETISKELPPNVSKPHARYPSPSDNWPIHILSEQPRAD